MLRMSLRRPWRLSTVVGALAAIVVVLVPLTSRAESPGLVFVQGGGSAIRLDVYVDERRNRAEIKRITEEIDPNAAYGYAQAAAGDRLQLRLASNELMRLWKGGAPITPRSGAMFESASQFLPVFLILDVTNDSTQPVQITGTTLEVSASLSDLQPLIVMGTLGTTCTTTQTPSFVLTNAGWGRADNATLRFAFGRDRPGTQEFDLALGSLGVVDVSVMRAATQLAPRLPAMQRQRPRCPSAAMLPQCLAGLERDGLLGGLAGQVRVREGGEVVTHLSGSLAYDWLDVTGAAQQARSPLGTDLTLFVFDVEHAECGAGAPAEGGYRPIKLGLDRRNYAIPLPYRGRVGPRENRRLELALTADRASRHLFRIVLDLSDGQRIASMPIDLSYFSPRIPQGEPRPVR